ncbi:hypothetical protein AlacWU_04531 [Aspergillus niger]|nr:hypothetical protein AlacWU_04531 [Aspergillus niger]
MLPRPSPPVPDKSLASCAPAASERIMHSAALDLHNVCIVCKVKVQYHSVSLPTHCIQSVGTAGREGIDRLTFQFCLFLCLHDAILRHTTYGSCPCIQAHFLTQGLVAVVASWITLQVSVSQWAIFAEL